MRALLISVILGLLATTANASGGKIVRRAVDTGHDLRIATYCVEGHAFVFAVADVGGGGGVVLHQIYEEVDGKIKPMTCEMAESR